MYPNSNLKVWKAKEGQSMDSYDWTSLRGNDRKKVLKRLPPLLLQNNIGTTVRKIWEVHVHEYPSYL